MPKNDKQRLFWIYILRTSNNALYTGYTTDIVKRYKKHRSGSKSCKYTRSFPPQKIENCWPIFTTKSIVLQLEAKIKKLSRGEKEELLNDSAFVVFCEKIHNGIKVMAFNSDLIEQIVTEESLTAKELFITFLDNIDIH